MNALRLTRVACGKPTSINKRNDCGCSASTRVLKEAGDKPGANMDIVSNSWCFGFGSNNLPHQSLTIKVIP